MEKEGQLDRQLQRTFLPKYTEEFLKVMDEKAKEDGQGETGLVLAVVGGEGAAGLGRDAG